MNARSLFGPRAIWLCALLTFATANAQTPARHSLSLDVKPVAAGGAATSSSSATSKDRQYSGTKDTYRETSYTSVRKTKSGTDIEIALHNFSQTPDSAKVEWYFFAKPVNGGEPSLHDSGSRTVAVGGGLTEKFVAECKDIEMQVKKSLVTMESSSEGAGYRPEASEKKTGSRSAGWLVRLLDGDQVLAVKASSPTFEAAGRSASKLAELTKKPSKKKK